MSPFEPSSGSSAITCKNILRNLKELCHEIYRNSKGGNCHQIERNKKNQLKTLKEGMDNTAYTKQARMEIKKIKTDCKCGLLKPVSLTFF